MSKTDTKQSASQLQEKTKKSTPSVLDIFREAWEAIPEEEELQAMPEDGAEQVDNYIYLLRNAQTSIVRRLCADTFHWVVLLNRGDHWNRHVVEVSASSCIASHSTPIRNEGF